MKNKIMYLIIGMLIGAIITSICFMALGKNKRPSGFPKGDFNFEDGERPELPEGMTEEDLKDMPQRPDGDFKGKRESKDSSDSSETKTDDATKTEAPAADSVPTTTDAVSNNT